jgi:hypothetical protein
MAWSDPSHSSFRFPYDGSRGVQRAKRGSFLHLFTKRVGRGAKGQIWRLSMMEAWVPPFMEGSWRLRPSIICVVCYNFEEGTLEEGAYLAGTSYAWTISDLSVLVERYHTTTCLCARDSSSVEGGSRAHCFGEIGIKEGRAH